MKPPEPTGEDTQKIERPPLLPLKRRAIIEEALAYLEDVEDDLASQKNWSPIPPVSLVRDIAKIGVIPKSGELHTELQKYKEEWEKEIRETQLPEYPSFADVSDLDDLLRRIDEQGGVAGRERVHLAERLREKILNVLGLRRLGYQLPLLTQKHEELAKEVLADIPRTQDLRTTVDRLTAQKAPAPIHKQARDTR